MSTPENDPRPLGHRRPWWQWNVITLMLALFALVWLRELASMDYFATWLLGASILTVWFAFPLVWEGISLGNERAESTPRPLRARQVVLRVMATMLLMLAWMMLALVSLIR